MSIRKFTPEQAERFYQCDSEHVRYCYHCGDYVYVDDYCGSLDMCDECAAAE